MAERVLAGERRALARVLEGEAIPSTEKVVSLAEPHRAIIPQHKLGNTAAFGHKVWLAEADGGIVTEVQVRSGAAADAPQVVPPLTATSTDLATRPICSRATVVAAPPPSVAKPPMRACGGWHYPQRNHSDRG